MIYHRSMCLHLCVCAFTLLSAAEPSLPVGAGRMNRRTSSTTLRMFASISVSFWIWGCSLSKVER
jgi:hypothetical protein|eukprot:COSAG01_NODE_3314_length_6276_cov_280.140845_5_plen_65_part_00